MDNQTKHSALDDYFTSMLTVPVIEESQTVVLDVNKTIVPKAELTAALETKLKPVLTDTVVPIQSEFKIPEPDGSGSLTDLDHLLGSVIDIDIADIDLSVLDNANAVMTSPAPSAEIEIAIEVESENVTDARITLEPAAVSITEVENKPDLELEASEPAAQWQNVELEERFQALFFEVAGVIFAVPLTELGGIHQIETVNRLFGKPDWFLGIMQHREQKLSVVDTAQWVMPEQNMGEIAYKYQIQLSDSNWVLGCESLHGTETLNSNDIKWRNTPGSRPWLAGMVKSRMCVLLHVTEMIKLLDNGINIHGQ
ncbi:MAG: chemotaxis protein CheW [Moritella sp.]|uniref:chemotaxis protein CheW n=1 Tax=Moritella sp. TaxID=78556 RepID=UPI0029AD62B9|nr:chemotaxis protein CheW [Moritella sp.]MDX2319281.1 chemotaxis protein CheW [Moritella sp.]